VSPGGRPSIFHGGDHGKVSSKDRAQRTLDLEEFDPETADLESQLRNTRNILRQETLLVQDSAAGVERKSFL
jgi:hypothetical protein